MRMFTSWFPRRSCPLPSGPSRGCVRPTHFVPLALFLIPSAIIGYAVVLPRHGVDVTSELSLGFASTLVGAATTYVLGVLRARRR